MNLTAIITGVGRLKEALECGKEVADPATWKNRSVTANKIAVVISFAFVVADIVGYDLPISDENIQMAAAGLAGVLAFVNIIVTLATSKKVGVK